MSSAPELPGRRGGLFSVNAALCVLMLQLVQPTCQRFSVTRPHSSHRCKAFDNTEGICKDEADCPSVTAGLYFPSFCELGSGSVGVCCKEVEEEGGTADSTVIPSATTESTQKPETSTASTKTTDLSRQRGAEQATQIKINSTLQCGKITFSVSRQPAQVSRSNGITTETNTDGPEGGSDDPGAREIVGGDLVSQLDFPWTAAVGKLENETETFFCGGTLVSNRNVLTAAHCVPSLGKSGVVLLGTANLSDPAGIRRLVRRVSVHPAWRNISGIPQHDLAMLHLDKKIMFSRSIVPACLPSVSTKAENRQGLVSGWGRQRSGGLTSQLLRSAQLSILPVEECRQVYGNIFSSGLLCARGKAFQIDSALEDWSAINPRTGLVSDSCQGDSGGGLILEQADGAQLLGVVSGGIGCGLPQFPGIYVDVREHLDWILNNIE